MWLESVSKSIVWGCILHEIDITVIIMAFNESDCLRLVVDDVLEALEKLDTTYELLIVDDGSTDDTLTIARNVAEQQATIRVISHRENLGIGEVYRTGFDQAKGRLVTFFPADGQFSPSIIVRFYKSIDGNDMVLGYLPNQKRSPLATFLSSGERVLYRILLGPQPRFQGIVMFKRKLLGELELKSTGRGWGVLMEFIIRADRNGYRLCSEPTKVRPRISGKSKVNNIRTIWANLKQILALRRHL